MTTKVWSSSFPTSAYAKASIFFAALAAVSCLFFASARPSHAYTCTFGSNDLAAVNNWNTAGNWGGCNSTTPQVGDRVIIPGATSTIMDASFSVQSVTTTGSIWLGTNTLAVVSSTDESLGAAIRFSSGAFFAGGTSTINGVVSSTSGSITFSNTSTIIGSNLAATIAGVSSTTGIVQFGSVSSTGVISTNSGTILFAGSSTQSVQLADNNGNLEVYGAGYVSSSAPTFNNRGTFNLYTGSASTSGAFANAGTINVITGLVSSTGAFTNSGTFTFTGAGTLSLGGNLTNTGTLTPSTSMVRAFGTASQSFPGLSYYNLESIKTSGTLTISASSTFVNVTSTNGGTISASTAGGFTVMSSLMSDTNSTLSFGVASGSIAGITTINGTESVSTGSVTSTGAVTVASGGTLSVTGAGILAFAGNLTNSGTVSTAGTTRFRATGTGAQTWTSLSIGDLESIKTAGSLSITTSSTFNNVTSTNGGTIDISGATGKVTVLGALMIDATSTLVIGAASTSIAGITTINGTTTVSTGSVTSTGAVTISSTGNAGGTLSISGAGTLAFGGALTNGGTITPGSSKIRAFGTGNQSFPSLSYYNLESIKTSGAIQLSSSSSTAVNVTSTNGGGISLNGYPLTVMNSLMVDTASTLTINDKLSVGGITTVNGTATLTSGFATSTGNMVVGSAGTVSADTGSTVTIAGNLTNSGTITAAGTSQFRASGTGSQTWDGLSVRNFESIKTAGTVNITASSTFNNVTSTNGGTISFDSASGQIKVLGTLMISATSTVNYGSASATITGVTTINGTSTVSTGSVTSSGAVTISSSGNAGGSMLTTSSGLQSFGTTLTNNGTFNGGSGTTRYTTSTGSINVAAVNYYNLALAGGATYTLTASTTAVGTTLVTSGGTLGVNSRTFTAFGTITNPGLMTVSTGAIVHPRESVQLTDTSGSQLTSYTAPASIYVTVQDLNRNLDGTSVETMTIPVTISSAGGSDTETMTLTETAVSSGIFRNTLAVPLVTSNAATLSNGRFELIASGVGTASYTDAQDSSDTSSTQATFTFTTVASSDTGGGSTVSGGGGGGSYYVTPAPVAPPAKTPTVQNPITTYSPIVVAPPVEQMPSAKVLAPQVTGSAGVTFVNLPSKATTQGQVINFQYSYKSASKAATVVTVTREVKDAMGKLVKKMAMSVTIKPGRTFANSVRDTVTASLKAGQYTQTVTVTNKKTKAVLGQGSFTYTVVPKPKPTTKK